MEIPIFKADSGLLVTADPSIRQAQIQLDTKGLKLFSIDNQNVSFTEDDFGKALLYDRDAMASFNHIIHYGMTEEKVLSSLTKAYCASGKCGSYNPDSGSSFNVNHLMEHAIEEFNIGTKILHGLEEIGSFTSILVALYAIGQVLFILCKKFAPGCTLTAPGWMRRWSYETHHGNHHELRPMLGGRVPIKPVLATAPVYTPNNLNNLYPSHEVQNIDEFSTDLEVDRVPDVSTIRELKIDHHRFLDS